MLSEVILETETEDIPIEVIRSRRRSIGLEIVKTEVKIRIPLRLSDREIKRFILEHEDWIAQKLEIARKRYEKRTVLPERELNPQEIKAIKEKFSERVAYYADIMGVTYGRITIRNQKTRWGSCSAKGNLNFQYQLYFLPEELMDYVIIHELAHRRFMNHSKDFWNVVEQYCPDYKKCRAQLKQLDLEA